MDTIELDKYAKPKNIHKHFTEMMNKEKEETLKKEIQHIFDSGANEIRIFEMFKNFLVR